MTSTTTLITVASTSTTMTSTTVTSTAQLTEDVSPPETTPETASPTASPTPEPTPLPVYAMVHEGGFCKGGTWVVVDDIEGCAVECSHRDSCVYFSYSDAETQSCKLNDECDINDHRNTYNIYMIGATASPTVSPTPMPPPTVEPTPEPTPLPVYAMVHEGGFCKQ